jgi:hypothetical protein
MAKDLDQKMQYIQDKVEEVSSTVHKIDKDLAIHKATFDDHLKQDEKMYEEFKRMNDILQQNTDSLKEHMHRTEVAEKQLTILEDLAKNIDSRLSPIEKQRIEQEAIAKYRNEKLIKIGKILGIVATLVAIIATIKTL